jgi:two-component sensor histidine kinase
MKKMKILIAEDDRATHRLLERLLKKWGYDVISAYDGLEAWEKLQEDNPPHLLLLDRIMPGLDGDELCRRVRESGSPNPAHVIYLTVKDTKDDVVFGLEEGAHDYITKPFHENELKARVDVGSRLVELQIQLNENISELRKKEDELTKSLSDKEILIREVHHRVKNNLNIIISLISLEESNPGKSAMEILSELKNRIHSIYSVHEKLFMQDQFINLNFKDYIDDLLVNIIDSFDAKAVYVRYSLEIEEINLEVETVVPLGLIVTELVTNSLKYAFPEDGKGTITVTCRTENDHFLMTVEDDGVSLPAAVDIDNAATLGLRLVKSLTDQLQGNLEIVRENGTKYVFTLPLRKKEGL